MRKLGLIIIGDEILAGHTLDTNTNWLAKQVKAMDVELRRVEVITDHLWDIEATVHRFLYDLDLDYVVTSGGLGPTPDDRTMQAIANVLGVKLITQPQHLTSLEERVAKRYEAGRAPSPTPNAGQLKMIQLPEGSESMPNNIGVALGCHLIHNGVQLWTLPGVPSEFKSMFELGIAPKLERGEKRHVEELVIYDHESPYFELLTDLEERYPDVQLGSYPEVGYIRIRATGNEARAKELMEEVRRAAAGKLDSA